MRLGNEFRLDGDATSHKLAEMSADQVAQSTGAAPAGAAPPGAPPGAAPPGAPPMDPAAAGDPMAGAAPPPMTLEDAAAQGDPLAAEMLMHRKLLQLIVENIATLMDNTGAQVPASTAVASQAKSIVEGTKQAAAPVVANSLGGPGNPGETGGKRIETGIVNDPAGSKARSISSHWSRRS